MNPELDIPKLRIDLPLPELPKSVEIVPHGTIQTIGVNGVVDPLPGNGEPALGYEDGEPEPLPEIEDMADFVESEIDLPPELIVGAAHKGTKIVIGGGSKAFKTWVQLDAALSVAYGVQWMNFDTVQGKVLYVNFEIPRPFFQRRIKTICNAKGIKVVKGRMHVWNLRGKSAAYDVIVPRIIKAIKDKGYVLIILDPIYKLYGDADENSAGDIALLMNALETICVEAGAAVMFGAHYSKGNQSGKESIDRISGSGVFARDPDSILPFTVHKEEGCFSVEPILRNLKPIAPFVVRWNYPLMEVDNGLDPAHLKQVVGKKKEHDPMQLLAVIKDTSFENPISVSAWATAGYVKRQTLQDYMPELRSRGLICTAGDGANARQYITEKGKNLLLNTPAGN